ncbi:hypothetical protein VIN7_8342 [Saccharomyces cerevisiae x Saccharomyces kudriavzevii VIN7]|uniref:Uncharacterized protein n=1 Tax=Saccharomyces cerevisiae x Saccharomyces kudriavzevii (strain VIN7) TaxID=1095631 RepID=H0GXH3_SACCK|nr:hypothetical protein VIN7_8342 [Saccharomyces cerevisiae x Saccharomyces kudriavzevii VIN7]
MKLAKGGKQPSFECGVSTFVCPKLDISASDIAQVILCGYYVLSIEDIVDFSTFIIPFGLEKFSSFFLMFICLYTLPKFFDTITASAWSIGSVSLLCLIACFVPE